MTKTLLGVYTYGHASHQSRTTKKIKEAYTVKEESYAEILIVWIVR